MSLPFKLVSDPQLDELDLFGYASDHFILGGGDALASISESMFDRLWRFRGVVPLSVRNRLRPILRRHAALRRYGLHMPAVALIRVADRVSIIENPFTPTGKGPFQQIVLWVNRSDDEAKAIANAVVASKHLPSELFRSVVEDNPQAMYISNMYQFLHMGSNSFEKAKARNFRTLIVAIKPRHPLPILVRMIWPQAKVLCVMRGANAIVPEMLAKADGVLADEAALKEMGDARDHALLLRAQGVDEIIAGIKAYIQTSGTPRDFYFYSIRGRSYEGMSALSDQTKDIILLGSPGTVYQAGSAQTFEEFVSHVVETADDILINSRWLYQLESMVAREDWVGVVSRILDRGGRSVLVEGAAQ